MTTPKNPAPTALAMANIFTDSGSVTVVCEPVSEWLAITPVFYMDENGKTWLDGTFRITHLPSGRDFANGWACINCCRHAGLALNALNVDWASLSGSNSAEWFGALDQETQLAVVDARSLDGICDAEYCDGPDIETPEQSAAIVDANLARKGLGGQS